MISRVPELLVNIAHIQKINVWQTWPAISVPGPDTDGMADVAALRIRAVAAE
jgi:hypothetical protein